MVDDDAPIRALVTKIVERAGFPVDSARDGAEAIEKIDQNDYAVLVIDLMMPKVDGYAVISHLRNRAARPAIIVITAGDSGAIRKLDGTVVHSVIRKPFDIDVLGDLIAAAANTVMQEAAAQPENVIHAAFPRDKSTGDY
ncbi:MAG: DNA-binding response regulator [Acidobacteria bacterium]|nr:DNA-binding response regulator [Acidobacteriota bacterium]